MRSFIIRVTALMRAVAPLALLATGIACAPASQGAVPPAPVAFRWPDPAFLPERQCHRAIAGERLDAYLQRASLALTVPGTQSVTVDRQRGCLRIVVDGVGSGRLAELIVRGVSVPRQAVVLLLASPERG